VKNRQKAVRISNGVLLPSDLGSRSIQQQFMRSSVDPDLRELAPIAVHRHDDSHVLQICHDSLALIFMGSSLPTEDALESYGSCNETRILGFLRARTGRALKEVG
jgi:hypothetical protein